MIAMIVAGALASANPPPAEPWAPGHTIATGDNLAQACSSTGRPGAFACVYYLSGVVGDAMTMTMIGAKSQGKPYKPPFCIPKNISIDDQIKLVATRILAKAELRTAPASLAVRYVYEHEWACKP